MATSTIVEFKGSKTSTNSSKLPSVQEVGLSSLDVGRQFLYLVALGDGYISRRSRLCFMRLVTNG